jgi:hypothetical protein
MLKEEMYSKEEKKVFIQKQIENLRARFPVRPAKSPFSKINKEREEDQKNERCNDAKGEYEID